MTTTQPPAISISEATDLLPRLQVALGIIASAHCIAERAGKETNWEAFQGQCIEILDAERARGVTSLSTIPTQPSPLPVAGGLAAAIVADIKRHVDGQTDGQGTGE